MSLSPLPVLPVAPNSLARPGTFNADSDAYFGNLNAFQVSYNINIPLLIAASQSTLDSETAASESATAADTRAGAANASALLAQDWAIKTAAPVSGGEYSSKYWAQIAQGAVATLPAGSINDATTATSSVWSSSKVSTELAGKLSSSGGTLTGALNEAPTVTIASAATTDIGGAAANSVLVTGTTTVTALGTAPAGAVRTVTFGGALILTHNGASLILPGAASIATTAGDVAAFLSLGAGNWRCSAYQKASGTPVVATPVLHVRDEKAAGTYGGVATSPKQRTLNTVVTNTIAGASLASDIVTLPAGTYDFFASAPSYANGPQKGKLVIYNNTTSADILVGQSAAGESVSSYSVIWSEVRGRFTLSASSDLILKHYAVFSAGTDATGYPVSLGSKNEVYAEAQFWKVA